MGAEDRSRKEGKLAKATRPTPFSRSHPRPLCVCPVCCYVCAPPSPPARPQLAAMERMHHAADDVRTSSCMKEFMKSSTRFLY